MIAAWLYYIETLPVCPDADEKNVPPARNPAPVGRAICPPSPARSAGNLPAVPRPDGPSSVIGLAGDARCHLPPRGKAFPPAARAICPPSRRWVWGKLMGNLVGNRLGFRGKLVWNLWGSWGKPWGLQGKSQQIAGKIAEKRGKTRTERGKRRGFCEAFVQFLPKNISKT